MGFNQFLRISFAFAVILSFVSKVNAQYLDDDRHIEVALRMIGHQILLSSNDSSSRVLPIIRENDCYKIQFESEFEFIPEDLVGTINQVVIESGIANSYIVEVEKCETGEVVYSFEMNNLEQTNIIPCRSRVQPKSCYYLLISLMNIGEIKAAFQNDSPDLSNGSYSEKSQLYTIFFVLFLLLTALFISFRLKRTKPKIDPNVIFIGKYQLDKKNGKLMLADQRIELSSKEADLLLLLYAEVNNTVERDVILSRVWGDNGNYVGRTLDVFISKLRKKLKADPAVNIVNSRGVGYKLVLDS